MHLVQLFGYSSEITASYLDGSAFSADTIVDAENRGVPVYPPCGIMDPSIIGDRNYSMTYGTGGIMFSFLDRGFYDSPYATRKGYQLTNLTIVSAPASAISSDMICP
jgi:hypothetical protein